MEEDPMKMQCLSPNKRYLLSQSYSIGNRLQHHSQPNIIPNSVILTSWGATKPFCQWLLRKVTISG